MQDHALFEAAPDGLILVDAGGHCRRANPAAARLLDRPLGAVVDHPFAEFVAPGQEDRLEALRPVHPDTEPSPVHLNLTTPRGGIRPAAITARAAGGGHVLCLRAGDIPLPHPHPHMVAHLAHMACWQIDPRSGRETWSPDIAVLHDLPADSAPGRDGFARLILPRVHPMDRPRLAAIADHRPPSADMSELDYRVVGADGVARHLHTRIAVLRDPAGAVAGLFGTVQDLSEHRHLADRLRESETRFRDLADTAPVLIRTINRSGRVVWANARWGAFLDDGPDSWRARLHPDDHTDCLQALAAALASGSPYTLRFRLRRRDGTWCWLMEQGLVRDTGEDQAFLASAVDISDMVEIEARLRHSLDQLAQSNDELERFAYIASHDLKEPVRVMALYAELLGRHLDATDPAVADYLGFITDGARRTYRLIEDLLTYSRVLQGCETPQPFALADALDDALADLAETIDATGAGLWQAGRPPAVQADRILTAKVFRHLIANALKFAAPGRAPEIAIVAETTGPMVTIEIRDNGVGIAAADLDTAFLPFKRLHAYQAFPGSGIGLALCRRVIERHGGRIWARSTPGAGSTFAFTLPVADSPP